MASRVLGAGEGAPLLLRVGGPVPRAQRAPSQAVKTLSKTCFVIAFAAKSDHGASRCCTRGKQWRQKMQQSKNNNNQNYHMLLNVLTLLMPFCSSVISAH